MPPGLTHLHKAHAYKTYFCELIDGLETMVHQLCQQLSKFLVVKNFQAAATRDLADSCGVKSMMVVAVPTLHIATTVTEAFSIHLPSNIVKMHSCGKIDRLVTAIFL